MPTVCKDGNCGNASCGFGKRRSAFGAGANSFFIPQYTGPANIQNVGACLKAGGYGNSAPSLRFGNNGNKKSKGPMTIKSKNKK